MTGIPRLLHGVRSTPEVRAYLRAHSRASAAARPGFAIAASLAMLVAMLAF